MCLTAVLKILSYFKKNDKIDLLYIRSNSEIDSFLNKKVIIWHSYCNFIDRCFR